MGIAAIIGCGLIGQGWAIVFARAGWSVRMYDSDPAKAGEGRMLVARQLRTLRDHGLSGDPDAILARVALADTLETALAGVDYVQENSPEDLAVKQALFAQLDALAPATAILASSTSSIRASLFSREVPGQARCLVAHPVNPPYLVPVVEVCGAPWTAPETIAHCVAIMREVGQKPVVVRREIEGFILNRLQGALLQEALRLAEAGYASVEDIDATVKDGLGLRWAFMGPFETIDLNAPGGIADYCARYNGMYRSIGASQTGEPAWQGPAVQDLEAQRRERLPAADLHARRFWRDERLMQLLRHKQEAERKEGEERKECKERGA
ncbi:3-hydroxyacyl-CoA dehydrogenase [Bordetella genomosp. 10]|uniref:3-hydroxyacyl-CoA dehydrogenase n=1 Tax=Bordetella genomosp. 10 TaxID=1416804 RepID=A0A261SD32_9BORD|nr:3-hydroxyacyl-CoA dehydrogenase [Bordetella genomosp. 10]OZI35055.1 3-hydroxyacyl-CoA dehydrogenase [Bordetella genomosp. 10]